MTTPLYKTLSSMAGGSWVSGEGDSGGYDGGGGFQPLDLSGGVRFGRRMFRAVLDQSPVQQSCDQGRRKRPPTEVGTEWLQLCHDS